MKRSALVPVIVIAGAASGVGKTTVTLGLLEALRRRGLGVQAFKVGPDFIDPGFHSLATGRPSYNLDGWICGREHALATVARRAADADVAVVEGVMGCFDGLDGQTDAGSTAQIAKWLGAPVVLVVDAAAVSRSAGAVVLGFERFDPDLNVAGVIFNRAGGPAHRRWLAEAVAQASKARIIGALPWHPSVALPERHLGLVTAAENMYPEERRRALGDLVEEELDVDALLDLASSRVERAGGGLADGDHPARGRGARRQPIATIGVARDEAFQFYYADNLDLLREAGARIVFWSPLHDRSLPDADGLYIGGGYPEVHAERLAANGELRRQVRAFAESGRSVYAECGGLMYLAEWLEDVAGARWPMVGILAAAVAMDTSRLTLGYREITTTCAGLLGPAGTRARGHEFHASRIASPPAAAPRAYDVTDGLGEPARPEGYVIAGALVSYVHLHFGSNPDVASNLVAACAARVG